MRREFVQDRLCTISIIKCTGKVTTFPVGVWQCCPIGIHIDEKVRKHLNNCSVLEVLLDFKKKKVWNFLSNTISGLEKGLANTIWLYIQIKRTTYHCLLFPRQILHAHLLQLKCEMRHKIPAPLHSPAVPPQFSPVHMKMKYVIKEHAFNHLRQYIFEHLIKGLLKMLK